MKGDWGQSKIGAQRPNPSYLTKLRFISFMGKIFVAQNSSCEEFFSPGGQNRKVSFPLHVLVSPKGGLNRSYASFILNVAWGGIFLLTDQPLPKGSVVFTKLLIAPDSKVLADFVGLVLGSQGPGQKYPGMFIKFIDFGQQEMNKLVACLEEKVHLVDQRE
jgi:hypothetical protein